MIEVWKIAPGSGADDWQLFLKNGCIGIGWLEDLNLRQFKGPDEILASLESRFGKHVEGFGSGAADILWSFVREIKPGHVVVANDAYNRMVGIGVIASDYLPPDSRDNPLQNDPTTHRHHVRLVDWLITKPADIAGIPPQKRFFVQRTISRIKDKQIRPIVHAYLKAYPNDQKLKRQLSELFRVGQQTEDPIPDIDIHQQSSNGEANEKLVLHIVRERDRKLVARKKATVNPPICEVCGFNSRATYGVDYCEVHHLTPLADLEAGTKTQLDDLAIVCANCHRILHLEYPPTDPAKLRQQLQQSVAKKIK